MADSFSDGGFQTGSYEGVIDGFGYTFDTVDHDLPVTQADAHFASGLPKGGAFVLGKQKLSVKINAIAGVQAPTQCKPFPLAVHGYASKWWLVGTMKISSANDGAKIRTYAAEIIQLINTPPAS